MSIFGIILLLLVAAIVAVGLFVWKSYNRLVTLRNRYQNSYSQIDVQLQRRYDLIPNLVETAKGYMAHERETLEAVIAARNQAMSSSRAAAAAPGDPQAMQQAMTAEAGLTGMLSRLMVVSEDYPDLKADQSMQTVMEELRTTENKISFARQAFNDGVTLYNTSREVFPNNLVANTFNFSFAELWQEVTAEARRTPRVSFS
ncbi:LemA family protein [cf. Phormidesmis sp. LEGE 11477]|uniref:LemA family protein n=1 Tax=cf. Phormidesmis sp. LEGE 11477 TaxID=1828680 RepID=UPI001882EACF|nr:LemA family protein [cf. Phormidesmis sp. LEGE 11477]MBE9062936.1 LemA family protein [cf. Phormidesmis sp. LEGE 11477]